MIQNSVAAGRRHWAGAISSVFALALILSLGGCGIMIAMEENKKKELEEEEPPLEETRSLESGETVTIIFRAESIWQPVPYVILSGQKIEIAVADESAYFADGAIRYRIGRHKMALVGQSRKFIVTRPGPLYFGFKHSAMPEYSGEVEVIVRRLD